MKKFTLLMIFFLSLKSFAVESRLQAYLELKAKCNYEEAIAMLEEWITGLDDPVEIEINLFRIFELIKYPELIDRGINAFLHVSGNKTVSGNGFLKARLDMMLNNLYLRKGYIDRALEKKDNSKFINKFIILLPDSQNGNSDHDSVLTNIGKYVKSFEASADPEGKLDVRELLGKSYNKTIFLKCELSVNDEAEYLLAIGKTGQTEIRIDGEKIFSNNSAHGFFHDQYFVRIFLSKGWHEVLIGTNSSDDGIKIALRLTDLHGNPVRNAAVPAGSGNTHGACVLKYSQYFQSLKFYMNHNNDPAMAFNTGYLLYAANLADWKSGKPEEYLSSGTNNDLLKSASFYYLGLAEKNTRKKNIFLNKSVNAFSRNIESLKEIAGLKLEKNYIYDANRTAESIKKIDPYSAEFFKYKALIFIKSGWLLAALKECEEMKRAGINSYAYEMEQIIYSSQKRYKEAFEACHNLFMMDKSNHGNLMYLLDYAIKAGRYDDADSILNQCARLFPNDTAFRLKHAELKEYAVNPGSALPYILHARWLSPFNSKILFKTGQLYHKLNNDETAVHFMQEALRNEPDNIFTKKYINFINNNRNTKRRIEQSGVNAKTGFTGISSSLTDNNNETKENNSIKRWLITGPYAKYGPSDMDYAFLPEIINMNEIPGQRNTILHDTETELNLKQYNYPEKGIAYAASAFIINGPIKLQIYSQSAYKLFINGKETITNDRLGIFNAGRILKIQGTNKITLMFKLFMEDGKDACLKVVATDEKGKVIEPEYTAVSNEIREFSFTELTEFQYQGSEQNSSETSFLINNKEKSQDKELEYAGFLFSSGYEIEFLKQIDLLKKDFPGSVKPMELEAKYYETRNIKKAIDAYKKILSRIQSKDSLKNLVNIYYKAGMYDEIIGLKKTTDPGLFRKKLIESYIYTGKYSEAKKLIFQGMIIKNDPFYDIKLGELSYISGGDPSMYLEKALLKNQSNFSLSDFRNYLETGTIDNPFKDYETNFDYSTWKNDVAGSGQHRTRIVSRKMVFHFYEDGGSRLFCEDIVQFNKNTGNKYKKYQIPFSGIIHPVRITTINNETSDDYHDILTENGETAISLQSLKDVSGAYISYYIDNPVEPRGLNFFSVPDIKIKSKDEDISFFTFKVTAPDDMNFKFLMNTDFQVRTETVSGTTEYSIELKDLSNDDTGNLYISFSNWKEPADFAMWYSGIIKYFHVLENEFDYSRFRKRNADDTVKFVYEFLSEEIHLTGSRLYSPQNPLSTLNNKKGSAEDKTVLASIMLNNLGIKSYLAFAGKNTKVSNSYISPEIFNAILLYIPLDVNKGLWLDFSDSKKGFGEIDSNFSGKDALVIIKKDEYEIKKIAVN